MDIITLTEVLSYFGDFTAFGAGVIIITQFLNNLFKVENSSMKQVVSWICSIILAVIGYCFSLGFFADFGPMNEWQGWVKTAIVGLGTGLYANGIYDIKVVHNFIIALFAFMKKEEPKDEMLND